MHDRESYPAAWPNPPAAVDRESHDRLSQHHHSFCVVCGQANPHGLRLDFVVRPDGSVRARFQSDRTLEGYTGFIHGGVIASLLDAAMTHCVFAAGHAAFTAELLIRFRHPVEVGHECTVSARIIRVKPPLYLLSAEMTQDSQVKARASGKFLEKPSRRVAPVLSP